MTNINTFHRSFIASILISTFLIYFTKVGFIAYGPVIILMILVVFLELYSNISLKKKNWLDIILWLPYVIFASIYYILNPYNGNYITAHFVAILSLPIITLSIIKLKSNYDTANYIKFNYNLIFIFLTTQLIVCLGQISTYLLGFGFPINEEYRSFFMISGTFTNSNDLGAIVLLIAFAFTCFEKSIGYYKSVAIWVLVFLLAIFSGSRSSIAFIFLLFLLNRNFKIQKVFIYVLVGIIFYFFLKFMLDTKSNDVLVRMSDRLDSLFNIIAEGTSVDGSVSLRLDSYLHFLNNIPILGLGSGEVGNYYRYSDNANFPINLIFENPHSLIVEVGYWLGIYGLIFFLIPVSSFITQSKKRILLLVIFLISSSIQSSVLASLTYFYFIIFCFFISREDYVKSSSIINNHK